MKIALVAKKGGVGKTTLCVLLHEAIRQTGQTVAIRDYDAQGSASKALARFGGTREQPGESYQVVLIDTPPSLTLPVTAAAVLDANVVLIPTTPSPPDVWEADEAARFARAKNPSAIVRIILNRTKKGTILTDAVTESLNGISVPILPVTLAERQSYQHVMLAGCNALDTKATNELFRLTVAITALR